MLICIILSGSEVMKDFKLSVFSEIWGFVSSELPTDKSSEPMVSPKLSESPRLYLNSDSKRCNCHCDFSVHSLIVFEAVLNLMCPHEILVKVDIFWPE